MTSLFRTLALPFVALSLSFGAAHAQDAMKAADPMKAGAMKSDTMKPTP